MPYLKPLPVPTEESRPFWEGLRNRQFLVPKCQDCGDFNWIRFPACRSCQSQRQEWTPVSGDATLWSYTVVHRGPGAFDAEVPYVVALAKLVEEPRSLIVLGNMVDYRRDDLAVGMPLKVVYEDIPEEDITVWRFAPAGKAS